MTNIAIIGSSGTIGSALLNNLSQQYPDANIYAFSSREPQTKFDNVHYHSIDYSDEFSIEAAAKTASSTGQLHLIFVTTGMLHKDDMMPEKSLRDLAIENFHIVYEANAIVPAMIAKHFLPLLDRDQRSVFAALSARAGSISDNMMGGWYSYRAAKAALNMLMKNAAIETKRKNKKAIVIVIEPGTVDSPLSAPFQSFVPEGKLFTPEFAAENLLKVLGDLEPKQTGKLFTWEGEELPP